MFRKLTLTAALIAAVAALGGAAQATGCGYRGSAFVAHQSYHHQSYQTIIAAPVVAAIVTPYVPLVTAAVTAAPVVAPQAVVAPQVAQQVVQAEVAVAAPYAAAVVAPCVSALSVGGYGGFGYGSAIVAPVVFRNHHRGGAVVVNRQKVVVRKGLFHRGRR